jgi:hypothetical protein
MGAGARGALASLMPLASVPGFAPLGGEDRPALHGRIQGERGYGIDPRSSHRASRAGRSAAAQQGPPPNPQLEVAKVKAGAEQFKAQADVQSTKLDMQAKMMEHHMDMQKLGMEQQAAQQDHSRSMQSQEGQERVAALKEVGKVTGGA